MGVTAAEIPRKAERRKIRYAPSYEGLFGQLLFWWHALRAMPKALHYRRQIAAIVADITIGVGALVVGAGTFFVIFSMSFFTGTQVGLEGFQGLRSIGAEAFTGLVSSWANTREITPLVAGVALAALFASYIATEAIVTKFFSLSPGTYNHYFLLFLPPIDVFYSLIKAVVFAILVTLIHCYYGYTASGGPAGVGVASGRAIRSSIVTVVVVNLFLSLLMWGGNETVQIAG